MNKNKYKTRRKLIEDENDYLPKKINKNKNKNLKKINGDKDMNLLLDSNKYRIHLIDPLLYD